jgi:hypothetical protein
MHVPKDSEVEEKNVALCRCSYSRFTTLYIGGGNLWDAGKKCTSRQNRVSEFACYQVRTQIAAGPVRIADLTPRLECGFLLLLHNKDRKL